MSTSHNIMVIYGFKADSPVSRDRKSGEVQYLGDWLEEHFPALEQINAGVSNGGSPDFFVGVVVAMVKDYTRSNRPYDTLPHDCLPDERTRTSIAAAYGALRELDPGLVDSIAPIGLYLIGDAA